MTSAKDVFKSFRGFNARIGGFIMDFENGYSVSVQFGRINYVEHTMRFEDYQIARSKQAEVAVLKDDEIIYYWGDDLDQVKGWQSPADVLALMNEVAALPGKVRK